MSAQRDSEDFPIPTSERQIEILARAFRIEARVAQYMRSWDDLRRELEERLLIGSKATDDRNQRCTNCTSRAKAPSQTKD